jgi:hypothetical protein
MTRGALVTLCILLIATPSVFFHTPTNATTAADLRGRITIDGHVDDYSLDEFILDENTSVAESPDDSRWGSDNDLRALALTWDNFNLYVAVPAVVVSTSLFLFVDSSCEGWVNLNDIDALRRNIEFLELRPNLVVEALRDRDEVTAGFTDCNRPFVFLGSDAFASAFLQNATIDGALELALPWSVLGDYEATADGVRLPERGHHLGVLAAVSGASRGTGAGDAGPDPTVVLERDSTQVAVLNNHVIVPLDSDGDGILDIGVSPRAVVSYATTDSEPVSSQLPLAITVDDKTIAPDNGETVQFHVTLDPPGYTLPVFLTARVYTSSGGVVRTLFANERRVLTGVPQVDEWDGRNDQGDVVPGGVYVIAVKGGVAAGEAKRTVQAAVAVIR